MSRNHKSAHDSFASFSFVEEKKYRKTSMRGDVRRRQTDRGLHPLWKKTPKRQQREKKKKKGKY